MSMPVVPLWLKWVLSLLVFGGMLVALVVVVRGSGPTPTTENPAAEAQANRLGQIVTAQDQAIHRAALPAAVPPGKALERAILADMRGRVSRHDINGPVERVRCAPITRHAAGRLPFRCTARAAGFDYPFAGVVDPRARELVWCKDDRTTVDPGLEVPLNPACTR